jgi:hypothetical protein
MLDQSHPSYGSTPFQHWSVQAASQSLPATNWANTAWRVRGFKPTSAKW